MFILLLYLLVAITLCVILYRELELTNERKSKKYEFFLDGDIEYILFMGRILWPVSIPIYLFYLLMSFFVKRLYNFISKFIK
jgi:hypothetical protein